MTMTPRNGSRRTSSEQDAAARLNKVNEEFERQWLEARNKEPPLLSPWPAAQGSPEYVRRRSVGRRPSRPIRLSSSRWGVGARPRKRQIRGHRRPLSTNARFRRLAVSTDRCREPRRCPQRVTIQFETGGAGGDGGIPDPIY